MWLSAEQPQFKHTTYRHFPNTSARRKTGEKVALNCWELTRTGPRNNKDSDQSRGKKHISPTCLNLSTAKTATTATVPLQGSTHTDWWWLTHTALPLLSAACTHWTAISAEHRLRLRHSSEDLTLNRQLWLRLPRLPFELVSYNFQRLIVL